MPVAALVTWIITALLGSYMVSTWASSGGLRQQEGAATHFRPPFVFGHLGLAVAGLVVWIVYLVNDSEALAWIAFVDLLVVAGIGDTLVYRWFKDRRGESDTAVGASAGSATLAEQRIPSAVVIAHGVFAVATLVLVLLAALEVGE